MICLNPSLNVYFNPQNSVWFVKFFRKWKETISRNWQNNKFIIVKIVRTHIVYSVGLFGILKRQKRKRLTILLQNNEKQ